jgi:hypothetical protein
MTRHRQPRRVLSAPAEQWELYDAAAKQEAPYVENGRGTFAAWARKVLLREARRVLGLDVHADIHRRPQNGGFNRRPWPRPR